MPKLPEFQQWQILLVHPGKRCAQLHSGWDIGGPKVVGGQSCGAYPGIDAPILDLRILEIPERQKLDPCMRSATSLCPGHRRIFCKVLSPISSTIAQTGRSSGA